ncbi:MAG: 3-hydroxyacyl-ACP dehydratase FabZ [Trueperaceae bacterium]
MVDVRAILPHRYPFLMVDAFVSQDGDGFECVKHVSFNEPWAVGHFPQEPLMPGVLIVEALAQAAAVGLHVREGRDEVRVGYLATIERARFRRKVVPGDTLRLTGTITRFRRGLCTVESVAFVGDEVAAEATLSFVLSG